MWWQNWFELYFSSICACISVSTLHLFKCHYKPIKSIERQPQHWYGSPPFFKIFCHPIWLQLDFSSCLFLPSSLDTVNQRWQRLSQHTVSTVGLLYHQCLIAQQEIGLGLESEPTAGHLTLPHLLSRDQTEWFKSASEQRDQYVFSSLLQTVQGWKLYRNICLFYSFVVYVLRNPNF